MMHLPIQAIGTVNIHCWRAYSYNLKPKMLKKYNELNRAFIKRLEVLPNIFEFSTEKFGIHEYAAIYGIEKVLRKTSSTKLLKSMPNLYLERQHKRLISLAANGEIEKFNYLSQIILRKSKSYRILSLNRTIKDWFILPIRNLRRIWNELSFIARTTSSDLKFKRVWIDKKPGDYARPLGVPTPAWRCYSFMWMDQIEKFQKAAGNLAPWQHGGRSGVGVLSCYKQLIPRLKEANTIYEFDIKGFFDNISHKKIIERFQETMGPIVAEWISKILEAKPMTYTLPPREEDVAVQTSERIMNTALDIIPVSLEEFLRQADEPGSFVLMNDEALTKYVHDPIQVEDDIIAAKGDWSAIEVNQERYKKAMNKENVVFHGGEGISETARAAGRDSWKNLGQPGKGVPQGLGTSPFLSTFMTDTYLNGLKDSLVMYMDDGILFAKSPQAMTKALKELEAQLGILELEIAPEKSKYVKRSGKWLDSIRFLGMRYLPESDTLMSDTRSGTKVLFPTKGKWDDVRNLAAINHTNVSDIKVKFDKLINTQAYEAGLKYGFLGCMIAGSQYKDNLPMEDRKEEIRKGQNRAWAAIEKSKGFIWKSQDLVNHTEYLTNVSSIACHRFAEFNRKGRKLFIRKGNRSTRRRI